MSQEFYFVSELNELLITASEPKELGLIMMKPFNSSYAQKWIITEEGYIQLSGTELVMDIDQQNKNKGAKIILWKKRNRENQKWVFTPSGQIQSCLNNFVLDIDQQTKKDGTPLVMWAITDQKNQKFEFIPCNNYNKIITTPTPLYPIIQENESKPLLNYEVKSFLCPLTGKRMKEPVVLIDSGRTYEKEAIILYSLSNDKDPITGIELKTKLFIPNLTLQMAIQEIYKENL